MTEREQLEADFVGEVPALRAFARFLTRDAAQADDLVQETVLKAWVALDRFEPGSNLRAWLFTIQRNTFYSLIRKRKWEVEDKDGEHAARLSQKPEQDGAMDMMDFLAAFETLPEEQREALILVGAAGFSHEEASKICGCAVGTVKSRLNRARTRLTELLDLGPEDEVAGDAAMSALAASQPLSAD